MGRPVSRRPAVTAAPAAMAVPAETAAWAAPGVLAGRLDYWGMSAGPETAGPVAPAELRPATVVTAGPEA